MKHLSLKLVPLLAASVLLSACVGRYPHWSDLPSWTHQALVDKPVLLQVKFEASEDKSFQCAQRVVAQQTGPLALDNVVTTDRPNESRSISFSKALVFKSEQLDDFYIDLSRCRFADQSGVQWSTLTWTLEKKG